MNDATAAPLLEARGIVKRFGEFEACRGLDLALRPGEKHALLGHNGAGKSTLVKMIYGVLQPTAGAFLWKGSQIDVRSPAEARTLGIGMVFQEFSLFEALSVAENVALALPPASMRELARRITEVSGAYGLAIEPDAPLHTLSVGERQRVEVLRCLLQDPELIIMDEPTSVLTPQEAESLFETLNRLAEEGRAVLYISHRLEEVRALCDQATILREGIVVDRCDPRETSARTLADKMIGKSSGPAGTRDRSAPPGEARLVVNRLSIAAGRRRGSGLQDVSLEVRGGEVVGVAGVAGEGQADLMDALIGETLGERADGILVDGIAVGRSRPTARRLAGMAFVPEDRNHEASVADMTLSENVLLSHHRAERLAPRGWIDTGSTRSWASRVREAFDVRAGSEHPTAGSLSGGNLQKFVVGREILRNPGVLAVCQPTRGVDAGASAEIRQALVDLASRGAAVLVISQDLDEIFEICDRIAVIHGGCVSPAYPDRRDDTRACGPAHGRRPGTRRPPHDCLRASTASFASLCPALAGHCHHPDGSARLPAARGHGTGSGRGPSHLLPVAVSRRVQPLRTARQGDPAHPHRCRACGLFPRQCLEHRGRRAVHAWRRPGRGASRFMHRKRLPACGLSWCSSAGILGGLLWAAIPALLKTRFNTNEILVSLMLTYVAALLLDWLVRGPWRDPLGFGFPESKEFVDAFAMPVLIDGTRLHAGLLIAIAASLCLWIMMGRTMKGFELRVFGAAPRAAAFAGFSGAGAVVFSLLLSGGLAGLAGAIEIFSTIGQLQPDISAGYGFVAIIVAFVGRLHPIGVLLAALVLAVSYIGGETAQILLKLPRNVTGLFQGMLLFFLLASDTLIHYRVRLTRLT